MSRELFDEWLNRRYDAPRKTVGTPKEEMWAAWQAGQSSQRHPEGLVWMLVIVWSIIAYFVVNV